MTAIADRYRNLASLFTEKVEGVPPDRWENQSPCAAWTARDLLDHVVSTTGMFFGFIGKEPPELPSVQDDPLGAWIAARDAMQAALDDPTVATIAYEGMFGPSTFQDSVDRFVCSDLVIHNWDLSRATGQDETLPLDEVTMLHEGMLPMDEVLRSAGVFGPQIEPPADADEQTRFLCFAGRQV